MVVLSDEGIHRHKLTERSAAQLECGVDVPRLGTGKELELLISGRNQVSPTPDSQVSAGTLMGYGQLLVQTLSPVGLWVSVSDGDG